MNRLGYARCAAMLTLLPALAIWPATAQARAPWWPTSHPDTEASGPVEPEDAVIKHDLTGPRVGFTVGEDGDAITQFGWHNEHQAAPRSHGPWFVVENIFLVGGVEKDLFLPSGTLVFGFRTPSGFEFGAGPTVAIGGPHGIHSSLVLAVGRTFNVGGIHVPVNLALATDSEGQRLTFVTGWAIRDDNRCHECRR